MEFSSWLDERFKYDVAARNNVVEKACFDHFRGKQSLSIVDVGSGTGSTFLALHSKIPYDQSWTFLEQDPKLISHSVLRIKKYMLESGFEVDDSAGHIEFTKKDRKITLHTINDSLLNIAEVVDLKMVDLVTASAIFDLFSIEQYIDFDKILKDEDVAILSVLNYTGMHFTPEAEGDMSFVDTYNAHMRRPQDFGIGMGPHCQKEISKFYHSVNRNYTEGESIWLLDEDAKKMHSFIIEYMDQGINDMPQIPPNFQDWLASKERQSNNGALIITVNHFDYFVA